MAVEEKLGGKGSYGVLHDEKTNMAGVEVNVAVVVKGTCNGRQRKSGSHRQGEDLVVPMLV